MRGRGPATASNTAGSRAPTTSRNPMLARYSVRSASTIPVGTSTLLTGNSAMRHPEQPERHHRGGPPRGERTDDCGGEKEESQRLRRCPSAMAPLISCGE